MLDRGTTWPWSSGDDGIATLGVIGGDPRLASAEVGQSVMDSSLDACDAVLRELRKP